MNLQKQKPFRSKKYRDAAKWTTCTYNGPTCNSDIETTVLAHKNGGGMAYKHSDLDAADMCSSCHDLYDGRTHIEGFTRERREVFFNAAREKTLHRRRKQGFSV